MKKTAAVLAVLAVLGGSIFYFRNDISGIFSQLPGAEMKTMKEWSAAAQEMKKLISTPPPIIAGGDAETAFLTKEGVIEWTNIQREKYGLAPLKENIKLNASAESKAKDMLNKQYFAHESPTGVGVGDLAGDVNYEYLAIGENLALGNFRNEEVLLMAWMDSTGHRENILNNIYQEIGVAVIKGIYEGEPVWFAVQHFGRPLSACPKPAPDLKASIEAKQAQLQEIKLQMDFLKIEIQNIEKKHREEYIAKVEQYNLLVNQYNDLVAATEAQINSYNTQVNAFNDCAASVTE